eukprot:3931661-Prymnesium_polylepis.1
MSPPRSSRRPPPPRTRVVPKRGWYRSTAVCDEPTASRKRSASRQSMVTVALRIVLVGQSVTG